MNTKIFIVRSPTLNKFGGIKNHCIELKNLFAKSNDEFDLSILTATGNYNTTCKKFFYNWNDIKNYIERSDCNIVHIHGFASPIIPQAISISKKLSKKIVYTPHYHPFETLRNQLFAKFFFYNFLKPKIKYLSRIITINKDEFKFFNQLSTKVSLAPHWITNNSFPYNKPCKDPKMLLFIGRNETNKGIDHLYALPKYKYNVHCVTNKKLERNDFTYHINIENEELSALYKKASLVIVPSKYEAFSLVALEALSHGTPVLASDRVRIADHIQGCSGFIVFTYGDYIDFMDKIESAQNLYVDSSKIKNIFSAEKALNRYSEIYRKVMDQI